jgi:DNA-binding MarR family transcriptional regulator
LSMQLLTTQASPRLLALSRLIAAHETLTRQLSEAPFSEHGLSLNEYEVLLLLSHAEERAMRRVDLAREVRLSPSGVTRMLDRLEEAGLVEKGTCSADARVTYAVLTDAGASKLQRCSADHVAAVERLLSARLDDEEAASLATLLGRLAEGADADCGPGA